MTTPLTPARATGLLSAVTWRGVPESPGPAHAFSKDHPERPALCGAYPHPRDVVRGGPCRFCKRTVEALRVAASMGMGS